MNICSLCYEDVTSLDSLSADLCRCLRVFAVYYRASQAQADLFYNLALVNRWAWAPCEPLGPPFFQIPAQLSLSILLSRKNLQDATFDLLFIVFWMPITFLIESLWDG